jgi:ABC-type amino acid transport substrate-binding protein
MGKGAWLAAMFVAILAVSLLASISVSAASAAEARGRYIVVLRDSVENPAAVAERQAENLDANVGHVYRHAINGYSAELPKAVVEGLRNDPRVKSVTRDHVLSLFSQSIPTGINRIFAPTNEALSINE